MTYLGHIVSESGIETDKTMIEAIKIWPVPKSIKDVRSFLGFTAYDRHYIKHFAIIARPLNDLLEGNGTSSKKKGQQKSHKKTPFVWTYRQQKGFETLKVKLSNPTMLAYADYSLPFSLHTDASSVGFEAILYQKQDGQDQVVFFASRR